MDQGDRMGLYNIVTGECVYERGAKGPIFHDPMLKLDMEDGIKIPQYAKNMFNGRSVVRLEDSDFDIALRLYATTILNKHEKKYEWRD